MLRRGAARFLLSFLAAAIVYVGYAAWRFPALVWATHLAQAQRLASLLDQQGELNRCDGSPATWSITLANNLRLFAVQRQYQTLHVQAPKLPANTALPPPGSLRILSLDATNVDSAALYSLERDGPCAALLLLDSGSLGVSQATVATTAVERLLVGLGVWIAAWLVAIVPLWRRLRQLVRSTQEVTSKNFEGTLPDGYGDELDLLARSFNQATSAARDRLRRLERRDEIIRETLADVIHDVRAPLTSLHLAASRFAQGPNGQGPNGQGPNAQDTNAQGTNQMVVTELTYLEGLIGNLQTLVQLEGNVVPLVRRPVAVPALAQRCVSRWGVLAAERHIRLAVAYPDGELVVCGDELALEQALSNLLQNALDFARENVSLRVRCDEGTLSFEVLDDGPGPAGEAGEHLTARRVQGASSRARGRAGHGLGLSIADQIAKRHGGGVTLGAGPEGGALASLRIVRGGACP